MSIGEITRGPQDWDAFYYAMADFVGKQRAKPRRKVGAVLVTPDRRQLSIGYNGFPPEIPDTRQNLTDPAMAHLIDHAEVNCLRQAPFNVRGCTLFVTYFPCHRCAQAIAQAGVTRIVAPYPDLTHPEWGESWQSALALLSNTGVEVGVVQVDVPVG